MPPLQGVYLPASDNLFVGRGLDPSRALVSAAELHGAVKTAPYKAVFYSILSKSGIKISMF